jgi:hypothetical protein
MIILSKTVRRECRGAMYGVCASVGALGAISGLKFGSLIHDNYEGTSANIISIILILTMVVVLFLSKIYTIPYLPRHS